MTIIVTSIAPGHKNHDNQQNAINSWDLLNGGLYSMNSPKEIEVLKPIYKGVEFVETSKTVEKIFGKPLVSINSMIDFAIAKGKDLILINSDIIISVEGWLELKPDGITMLTRHDYDTDTTQATKFPHGFDFFFIPNKFLSIFPPSIYAMGLAWWDYFLPLRVLQAGIPLYWPQGKHIFHKLHETQYSNAEWEKVGEYFRLDFGWDKSLSIGQIATAALLKIQNEAIK